MENFFFVNGPSRQPRALNRFVFAVALFAAMLLLVSCLALLVYTYAE